MCNLDRSPRLRKAPFRKRQVSKKQWIGEERKRLAFDTSRHEWYYLRHIFVFYLKRVGFSPTLIWISISNKMTKKTLYSTEEENYCLTWVFTPQNALSLSNINNKDSLRFNLLVLTMGEAARDGGPDETSVSKIDLVGDTVIWIKWDLWRRKKAI